MRIFSTAFVAEKNKLEGAGVWTHLVEVYVGVGSVGYFASHTETVTWNSQAYMPVPMRISAEEQSSDGSLPQISIDVSNPAGRVYQMAKQNDLALRPVIVRLVNLNLTNSGDDARVKMKILGTTFAEEIGKFTLGFGFNFDAEGPKRIYNRRDHDCVPIQFRNYAIVG
jgi:hypothetical protein